MAQCNAELTKPERKPQRIYAKRYGAKSASTIHNMNAANPHWFWMDKLTRALTSYTTWPGIQKYKAVEFQAIIQESQWGANLTAQIERRYWQNVVDIAAHYQVDPDNVLECLNELTKKVIGTVIDLSALDGDIWPSANTRRLIDEGKITTPKGFYWDVPPITNKSP